MNGETKKLYFCDKQSRGLRILDLLSENIVLLKTPFGYKVGCRLCHAECELNDYDLMKAIDIQFNHKCNSLAVSGQLKPLE